MTDRQEIDTPAMLGRIPYWVMPLADWLLKSHDQQTNLSHWTVDISNLVPVDNDILSTIRSTPWDAWLHVQPLWIFLVYLMGMEASRLLPFALSTLLHTWRLQSRSVTALQQATHLRMWRIVKQWTLIPGKFGSHMSSWQLASHNPWWTVLRACRTHFWKVQRSVYCTCSWHLLISSGGSCCCNCPFRLLITPGAASLHDSASERLRCLLAIMWSLGKVVFTVNFQASF